jgi:hypothetical protein
VAVFGSTVVTGLVSVALNRRLAGLSREYGKLLVHLAEPLRGERGR